MAEKQEGLSSRLHENLRIGELYSTMQIEQILALNPGALMQTGVFRKKGSDAFIILVTLNKDPRTTQYNDMLLEDSAILFWEGQTNRRIAEESFTQNLDCYVFVRDIPRSPYTFYGRAIIVRAHINPPGKPSQFVLSLPEFESYYAAVNKAETMKETAIIAGPSEKQDIRKIRITQKRYRDGVIDLWHGQCAVTGVDETSWLIASHIKPWRESSDFEKRDPKNSLLLSPDYDKLFDRGVISFNPDTGKIILPETTSYRFWKNLDRLGINDEKELSFIPEGTDKYLAYHNNRVFGYKPSPDFDIDSFVADMVTIPPKQA